jgi:hypothetical protein
MDAPNSNEPKPVLGTTPSHRREPGTEPKPEVTPPATPVAPTTEKVEPTKEPVVPSAPAPEEDYKKKFSESSAEANRMLEIMKKNGIDPKTGEKLPQPNEPTTPPARQAPPVVEPKTPEKEPIKLTEQDLAKAIPGFENLPPEEKEMIRDIKTTVKTMAELKQTVTELYDEKHFANEMKALTRKEDFKQLTEHTDEFKEFAYKDENLRTPLETLAKAFLYEKGKKPAEPTPVGGVEPGGSGGRQGGAPVQEDGMTGEEVAALRKSDPLKYNKLAAAGKIKFRD